MSYVLNTGTDCPAILPSSKDLGLQILLLKSLYPENRVHLLPHRSATRKKYRNFLTGKVGKYGYRQALLHDRRGGVYAAHQDSL